VADGSFVELKGEGGRGFSCRAKERLFSPLVIGKGVVKREEKN